MKHMKRSLASIVYSCRAGKTLARCVLREPSWSGNGFTFLPKKPGSSAIVLLMTAHPVILIDFEILVRYADEPLGFPHEKTLSIRWNHTMKLI